MPRQTDTRDRMLRTAATLFREQGYHATGLNQVLSDGRAPKGSLYFHFPGGKEQLAVESVALAGAELRGMLAATLAGTTDPADAVDHVIGVLGDHLVASDFRRGCPIATVALDAGAQSEPIRAACADVYDSWRSLIAAHLRAAGLNGPDALATLLLATIEGAVLLARTQRNPEPLRTAGAYLRLLLTDDRTRSCS